MSQLIGEYDCKIDAKGRVLIPMALKKQLPTESQDKFVVNRGFEPCLVMYPHNEWEKISDEINKLNLFNQKNRDFARYFFRGATALPLDKQQRVLLPKSLLDYANIETELVLLAYGNKIEIWSKKAYENLLANEPADFSSLAEEVMGGINQHESNSVS